MDLIVTIGLIFLVTLAASIMRSWRIDRCLRSFDGFNVMLRRQDGKLVWGRLRLTTGGMEFAFDDRREATQPLKTTYLLYAGEYGLIQSIFRYADRLSDEDRRRREKDLARSFHPGPMRRLVRAIRNFTGSATTALQEVLALVMGRVQKAQDRYVAAEGADALTKLGGTVLTDVSSIHDPLLERQVGRQVVVEVIEDDEIHEHVGVLKEYSADFLQLLDVQYPETRTIEVAASSGVESGRLAAHREGGMLRLVNRGDRPVLVVSLTVSDAEQSVDALLDSGGTIALPVDELAGKARLQVQSVRDLDMIVPRSRSAVRHRAEPHPAGDAAETTWDTVFDLGTLIRRREDDGAAETRLREQLEHDPANAAAAATLGALLLRRQDLAEAGRWLRAAYNCRESLPDGGRRVRMQLRDLSRRLAQRSAACGSDIEPPATNPTSPWP